MLLLKMRLCYLDHCLGNWKCISQALQLLLRSYKRSLTLTRLCLMLGSRCRSRGQGRWESGLSDRVDLSINLHLGKDPLPWQLHPKPKPKMFSINSNAGAHSKAKSKDWPRKWRRRIYLWRKSSKTKVWSRNQTIFTTAQIFSSCVETGMLLFKSFWKKTLS